MADDHVEQPGDPVHELIQRIVEQRHDRIKAHEELRASQPYRAVIVQINRLLADYGTAINAIDLMATRHPPYFETLITLRMKQHFVQSVVASIYLVKDGMLGRYRRFLRLRCRDITVSKPPFPSIGHIMLRPNWQSAEVNIL